jgi:hypothetical protein
MAKSHTRETGTEEKINAKARILLNQLLRRSRTKSGLPPTVAAVVKFATRRRMLLNR